MGVCLASLEAATIVLCPLEGKEPTSCKSLNLPPLCIPLGMVANLGAAAVMFALAMI